LAVVFFVVCSCAWHHPFDEPEKWAKEFDDPARDAWQKPDEVIRALALKNDARIADLGSGTGYFAVRLARALPQGWVYALDVEPAMTQYLEDRAAKEELINLLVLTTPAELAAVPEPVDCVLVVNTYHHLEGRTQYFNSLKQMLRPGGRVVIIDFDEQSTIGPPKEHRLAASAVEAELKEAGYTLGAHPDFLPNQYFLVFEPAPAAAAR
jgi:ubiquinone/menaquinone biosynthesis C-methylase UbiE